MTFAPVRLARCACAVGLSSLRPTSTSRETGGLAESPFDAHSSNRSLSGFFWAETAARAIIVVTAASRRNTLRRGMAVSGGKGHRRELVPLRLIRAARESGSQVNFPLRSRGIGGDGFVIDGRVGLLYNAPAHST